MKNLFKKCTAVLTACVIAAGAFAHLMTRETYAYSFAGQDSNVTSDIKVNGIDTGADYTRVHLGSSGGYGANRLINIVEANFEQNPALSLEVFNIGTYSTSRGSIVNTVKGYSEGDKKIIAAVNGDWMNTVQGDLGIPSTSNYYVSFSSMLLDGEIWCSQMSTQELSADYFTLGFTTDRQIVIGKPKVITTIKNVSTGTTVSANGVNRAPANNAVYVYNNRIGSSNYVPSSAYEVAVRVSGSNKFMNNGTVTGTVIGIYPSGSTSRQALSDDVIVLYARGNKVSQLSGKFSVGHTVTVSTYMTDSSAGTAANEKWSNCEEAIGGQILVMKDGRINNNLTSSTQYPTNLIGVKGDGSIMFAMVTADSHGVRTGLRYNQIPSFCQAVGYDTCFMLDGGGSTAMVTLENDTYVERACYSDGSLRNVWNGIALVYEQQMPSYVFNSKYYYDNHPDLQTAIGFNETALLNHFIQNGIKEGRRASVTFDIDYYLNQNNDLKAAFGSDREAAMEHFLNIGYNEVRATAPIENLGDDFVATIDMTTANLSLGVDNTNVATTSASDNTKQWRFKRNTDGSYTIVHLNTGDVLDIYAGLNQSGANVQIYDSNGSNAQKFFIHKTLDGYYVLRPKCSAYAVLDVAGGSTAAGANVQIYESNGTAAQKFKITQLFSAADMNITLKSTSKLKMSEVDNEKLVFGVSSGTYASNLVTQFNDTCVVYDMSGNVKAASTVRTGDTVRKMINGVEAARATIIVVGDTNGDEIINGRDLIIAKKALLEIDSTWYPMAADIDLDGVLEQSDLEKLSELIH